MPNFIIFQVVQDNPAPFGNPLQFEITFECLQSLQKGRFTTIPSQHNNCSLTCTLQKLTQT